MSKPGGEFFLAFIVLALALAYCTLLAKVTLHVPVNHEEFRRTRRQPRVYMYVRECVVNLLCLKVLCSSCSVNSLSLCQEKNRPFVGAVLDDD